MVAFCALKMGFSALMPEFPRRIGGLLVQEVAPVEYGVFEEPFVVIHALPAVVLPGVTLV